MIDNDLARYGVETRIVMANFSKSTNMPFYDNIMEQVKDIDIGLVVLNAGVAHRANFVVSESKNL